MLYYAIAFIGIAITAGLYGISGLTDSAAFTGTFLFSVFLVMAAACLLFGRKSRSKSKLREHL
jgi:uncharacterized membrane protein YtjA (UPF0391 family)